jgi:hypothetical protein
MSQPNEEVVRSVIVTEHLLWSIMHKHRDRYRPERLHRIGVAAREIAFIVNECLFPPEGAAVVLSPLEQEYLVGLRKILGESLDEQSLERHDEGR